MRTAQTHQATARPDKGVSPASHPVCQALLVVTLLAGHGLGNSAEFLDPEQAFQVSARVTGPGQAEVLVRIAPGYYVYREPLRFSAAGATLGAAAVPKGKVKFDENFQKNVETFRGDLRITVPVLKSQDSYTLQVVSQGCADAGLCYPPMTSSFTLAGVKRSAR